MAAQLTIAVNGGTPTTGGMTASVGDVLRLRSGNTEFSSYRFEIYGFPPGFSAAGWTYDSSEKVWYSLGSTPDDITIVVAGDYLSRLRGDAGASASQIDETSCVRVLTNNGLIVPASGYNRQMGTDWAEDQATNAQAIDAGLAGVGTVTVRKYASLAAFRAETATNLVNGDGIQILSPPLTLVWSASTGAGFVDDDGVTNVKLTETDVGSNGRAYPTTLSGTSVIVATYAALRAVQSTQIKSFHVLSRSSYGDGGAGHFPVLVGDSTSTDDDGTLLVTSGGQRVKRQWSGPVHAEWFGLVAGAGQDNSARLRAAVVAAMSDWTTIAGQVAISAVVEIPAGEWYIQDSVSLGVTIGSTLFGCVLRGAGAEKTTIVVDADVNTDGVTMISPTQYGRHGGVERLKIMGIKDSWVTSRDLLVVENWAYPRVRETFLEYAGGYGLNTSGCIDSQFANGTCSYCAGHGAVVGATTRTPGVNLGTTTRFRAWYFRGNFLAGCYQRYNQLDVSYTDTCIFESNGLGTDLDTGVGLLVSDGKVVCHGPYFENNTIHNFWAGYQTEGNTFYFGINIHMVNPINLGGGYNVKPLTPPYFSEFLLQAGTFGHIDGGQYFCWGMDPPIYAIMKSIDSRVAIRGVENPVGGYVVDENGDPISWNDPGEVGAHRTWSLTQRWGAIIPAGETVTRTIDFPDFGGDVYLYPYMGDASRVGFRGSYLLTAEAAALDDWTIILPEKVSVTWDGTTLAETAPGGAPESTIHAIHGIPVAFIVTQPFTFRFRVKGAGTPHWVWLADQLETAGCWFNWYTGEAGTVNWGPGTTSSITPDGDGYICEVTTVIPQVLQSFGIGLSLADNTFLYTRDGTGQLQISDVELIQEGLEGLPILGEACQMWSEVTRDKAGYYPAQATVYVRNNSDQDHVLTVGTIRLTVFKAWFGTGAT